MLQDRLAEAAIFSAESHPRLVIVGRARARQENDGQADILRGMAAVRHNRQVSKTEKTSTVA